jgi:hypothetical protein
MNVHIFLILGFTGLGGLAIIVSHWTQNSWGQIRPRMPNFKGCKIRSRPSFRWEVKPSAPHCSILRNVEKAFGV